MLNVSVSLSIDAKGETLGEGPAKCKLKVIAKGEYDLSAAQSLQEMVYSFAAGKYSDKVSNLREKGLTDKFTVTLTPDSSRNGTFALDFAGSDLDDIDGVYVIVKKKVYLFPEDPDAIAENTVDMLVQQADPEEIDDVVDWWIQHTTPVVVLTLKGDSASLSVKIGFLVGALVTEWDRKFNDFYEEYVEVKGSTVMRATGTLTP